MKFIKGVIIGSMVGASVAMMYADGTYVNKKRIVRKGKQWAKKIGVM